VILCEGRLVMVEAFSAIAHAWSNILDYNSFSLPGLGGNIRTDLKLS